MVDSYVMMMYNNQSAMCHVLKITHFFSYSQVSVSARMALLRWWVSQARLRLGPCLPLGSQTKGTAATWDTSPCGSSRSGNVQTESGEYREVSAHTSFTKTHCL